VKTIKEQKKKQILCHELEMNDRKNGIQWNKSTCIFIKYDIIGSLVTYFNIIFGGFPSRMLRNCVKLENFCPSLTVTVTA
jgi:hypothetical protein